MDEKGYIIGVIGRLKVIISKQEKKAFMTQDGNRQWVTLVECISMAANKLLRPSIMFKER